MTSYELDSLRGLPHALRLRTIHVLALSAATALLAAALQWPHTWRFIALMGLAVTSLLFALAAGREWVLSGKTLPSVRFRPLPHIELSGARGLKWAKDSF